MLEKGVSNGKVRTKHRRAEFVAVGAIADEGVDQAITLYRLSTVSVSGFDLYIAKVLRERERESYKGELHCSTKTGRCRGAVWFDARCTF